MRQTRNLLALVLSQVTVLSVIAQWTGVTTPAMYHHYSIEAITDDVLFAGGYGGSLVKSTDGGATWQSVSLGTGSWVQGIHFSDLTTGWVVTSPGDLSNGNIYKTTDGGTTWNSVQNAHNYSSMTWPSATTCYVGTWEGVIVKSTDSGATWTELNLATTENIPYIFFLDEQNGFAATTDGKFFRTNDGGSNWEMFNHTGIHEFYFFDTQNGYCVDEYGRIGATTDGGETFTYWTSPYVSYKLHDIEFLNNQIGYVIGGLDCTSGDCITKPVILRTTDGGATWIDDTDHPYMGQDIGFYAITLAPNGTPFIAGSDKIILKNEALAAGIKTKDAPVLTLYPNPANDAVFLETEQPLVGETIYLTNSSGQVLLEQVITAPIISIAVDQFSPGMYFIRGKENKLFGRFSKQ